MEMLQQPADTIFSLSATKAAQKASVEKMLDTRPCRQSQTWLSEEECHAHPESRDGCILETWYPCQCTFRLQEPAVYHCSPICGKFNVK